MPHLLPDSGMVLNNLLHNLQDHVSPGSEFLPEQSLGGEHRSCMEFPHLCTHSPHHWINTCPSSVIPAEVEGQMEGKSQGIYLQKGTGQAQLCSSLRYQLHFSPAHSPGREQSRALKGSTGAALAPTLQQLSLHSGAATDSNNEMAAPSTTLNKCHTLFLV